MGETWWERRGEKDDVRRSLWERRSRNNVVRIMGETLWERRYKKDVAERREKDVVKKTFWEG